MGDMTYAEMKVELTFLLRNRTDPDATDSSRIGRWFDQAYGYMVHPSVHKFREMQSIGTVTLASGTNEYDISTITDTSSVVRTPLALRWVTYIDATSYTPTATKRKLLPKGMRWFERRTLSTGRPFNYTIDGNSLFVSGVPGSSEASKLLRIGFYREPAGLGVSNIGRTELPTYFDRPLLKFAQAFAEADLGDRAKALITLKEAAGLINNAQEETEMEAEDEGFQTEIVLQPAMGF